MNNGKLKQILSSKLKFSRPALAGILGIFVLSLLLPMPAQAGIVTDTLMDLLAGLLLLLAQGVGLIANALIGILVEIVQYNGFINAPAVVKGWVVIRDVVNMFFIVILLAIAFGTVFRVEEYQYKHLLSKLLIMAVLVNFSKSIAGFFIDFAQVVMLTFVNGFKDAAAGNFINGFHIKEMFQFAERGTNQTTTQSGTTVSSSDFFFAAALALVTITIATIVIGVYIVVFTLRIIMLWLLVIISPAAYILQAFPGDAKKYASQWWDYFGKYASSGPILAFFLWLSLAVMQMSGGSTGSTLTGVSSTNLSLPAAAITGIGQSEVLLSFIISIMMLLGGLWMTQQLGVAGGKLAGSAMSAIQKGGSLPFKAGLKLAGKGTKALGSYAWEEASSRMGIQGLKERWVHGWKEGQVKRRDARRVKMENIYEKRRDKGSALQYLASPEHFFTHIWNWKTLGKAATLKLGDVTGKTSIRAQKKAEEARKKKEEMGKQITDTRGEKYRTNLLNDSKIEAKKAGDLGKKRKDLDTEYDVKERAKKKEIKTIQDQQNELLNNSTKASNEANKLDADINTLNIRANSLQAEADQLKVDADDAIKKDDKIKATSLLQDRDTKMREKTNVERIISDKEKQRDKKITEGISFTKEAANKGKEGIKLQGELVDIQDNRSRIVGAVDKEIDNTVLRYHSLEDEAKKPLSKLDEDAVISLNKEADRQEQEATHLEGGGLTEKQKENRDKEIKALDESIKKLTEEITAKKDLLSAQNRTPIEIATLMKSYEDDLVTKKQEKVAAERYLASPKELEANKKIIEDLQVAARTLREEASKPITTEADRDYYRREQDKYATEEAKWQKVADTYRPSTDYDIRRDQRSAISEEKKKMTTDNWQELVKIFEDAKHAGDLTRAAAAYHKATEYGNENEFQNHFGYDSDARGMKQFIENELIKGLGMSNEQALSIASDVSYAGEKVNHWGVARAVVVKNGKLDWANEDDRMVEVLAEVRKKDFEGFMRNANRLAYGNEIVGLGELPANATKEQRAAHFRAGGDRGFELSSFGQAFIMENYDKFGDLLKRGRFNVNLAVKIASGDNLHKLEQAAREKNIIPPEKFEEFEEVLEKIKNFAGSGGEEFGDIKKLMQIS